MNDNGKILRIKQGYNPNSSSVGSAIPMFLALSAASGAVALIALNVRSILRDRQNDKTELNPHGKDANETITDGDAAAVDGVHDRV